LRAGDWAWRPRWPGRRGVSGGGWVGRRMGRATEREHGAILPVERAPLRLGHLRPAVGARLLGRRAPARPPCACSAAVRLLGRRAHRQQQVFEVLGPGLGLRFFHKRQLAQVMHVAQRLAAVGVRLVARPAVMDAHAPKAGQDANGLGRRAAPVVMPRW
jgi:hypothetical protein